MNNSNRLVVNTLAQYVRTIINVLLSLYSSRLVLQALGVSDFGIYNLVGGVVSFLSFITNALLSSTQRYISVAQGENDRSRIKQIFNESVVIHIAFGLLVVLLLELFTPLIYNGFLNIPADRLDASKIVYQLVLAMLLISIVMAPYRALLVSHEDIVYSSIWDILDGVFKVVFVIILMNLSVDQLVGYAWIMLLIRLFDFAAYLIYDHIKYEECCFPTLKNFNFGFVKELSVFAGWLVYDSLCHVGQKQGLAIVFNRFAGTVINAAYGIGIQVAGFISFVSSSFSTAINPQLMKAKGGGDMEKMWYLSMIQSKYAFLLLGMVAVPLIFEINPLLSLWLVEVPPQSSFFAIMIIVAALVDQLTSGLSSAARAYGRLGKYTLVTNTPKLLTVPAIWFALYIGLPFYSVFIIFVGVEAAVMLTRIPLLKSDCGLNTSEYFKFVFTKSFLPIAVNILVCFGITSLFSFNFRWIITFMVSIPVYVVFIYFYSMKKNEQELFVNMLKKFLSKLGFVKS